MKNRDKLFLRLLTSRLESIELDPNTAIKEIMEMTLTSTPQFLYQSGPFSSSILLCPAHKEWMDLGIIVWSLQGKHFTIQLKKRSDGAKEMA